MMQIVEFQRRAVMVPFVEFGRDFDGWDCWGLAICAYREILGIEIEDFAYDSVRSFKALMALFDQRDRKPDWEKCGAQPLSLAAIYRRGHVIHTGLVVDKRRILHSEEDIGTCVELISQFRIEGFYRHVEQAGRGPAPV